MVHAVQQQGVNARIGRQHFKNIARSRVAIKYAGDVFTNADNNSP
jgi:hypothetical protein